VTKAGSLPQPITAAASSKATPRPSAPADVAAVMALLRLEGDARAAATMMDLRRIIVTDTRRLTRAQQIFFAERGAGGAFRLTGCTGLDTIDRSAPLLQRVEGVLRQRLKDTVPGKILEFTLEAGAGDDIFAQYPYREALCVPLLGHSGRVDAALMLVRAEPWTQADVTVMQRLASAFAQARHWLTARSQERWLGKLNMERLSLMAGAILLVALVPVTMTTLAPVEITARGPTIVAAPIDGVVDDVAVVSGQRVEAGDRLLSFNATTLRNRYEVAERELQLADTRVKKTALLAISDVRGRHELTIARAEHAVKSAERDFARDMLSRSSVATPRSGVVIVGDHRDIVGRPHATGERILEIADPLAVEARIDLPVNDALVLGEKKTAKLFLDSQPLSPIHAAVVSNDYQARTSDAGVLSYRMIAHLPADVPLPRLGTRGTAQLYGDRVPLIWYLLRRPLTALRPWLGL
jgi:Biotin-lipoyl like